MQIFGLARTQDYWRCLLWGFGLVFDSGNSIVSGVNLGCPYNSDWLFLKSGFSIALLGPIWLLIFSFWKDGSGGIFPKLWCRTSQTLRSQRLHGGRSGSGKFFLSGWSFYFEGHKIMHHLAWLLLYLQVKVPLMSEPQGDWFTSQPASPACFCRYLIKVNLKIWKTLSTLMVS